MIFSFTIFLIYAFLFAPILILVIFSFNSSSNLVAFESFSLKWYEALFNDVSILSALVNSIEIAFMSMLLSGFLGLCIGLTNQRIFKKLPVLPIVLPEVVQGLALLSFFIWIKLPLGKLSVILAHSSFGAAYVATMVRSRLSTLDPLLKDAASDLGAKPVRAFFKVILPQLSPALVSGMLIVFTMSFDDFIVSFFTAGVGSGTLPLKIYSMLKFGVTPSVNALSTMILCVSIMLIFLAFWMQPKEKKEYK
ncbi:MAG: ABC transporter permease [Oligoflexia bacterium]|nr:ABC transporter permease [Oligoflexia bacterium]